MKKQPPSIEDGCFDVAIIGSGPIGLDAGLAAAEAGLRFVVFERGPQAASNIRDWGHVRLLTPWPYNVSPRMRRVLCELDGARDFGNSFEQESTCPLGRELVEEALEPVAGSSGLVDAMVYSATVRAVGKEALIKPTEIGTDRRREQAFRLLVERACPATGQPIEGVCYARFVLDCSGSLDEQPALGNAGIPAPGERALGARFERQIPDLDQSLSKYSGQTIALFGAGHSAQTAAVELSRSADRAELQLDWIRRGKEPVPCQDEDPLSERDRLQRAANSLLTDPPERVRCHGGYFLEGISENQNGSFSLTLASADGSSSMHLECDHIMALCGSTGDHQLYRELHVQECYATSGPFNLAASLLGETDCLATGQHGIELLQNPEYGFFILGSKSYGRQSTFLMQNGWAQNDEVFGWIRDQLGSHEALQAEEPQPTLV